MGPILQFAVVVYEISCVMDVLKTNTPKGFKTGIWERLKICLRGPSAKTAVSRLIQVDPEGRGPEPAAASCMPIQIARRSNRESEIPRSVSPPAEPSTDGPADRRCGQASQEVSPAKDNGCKNNRREDSS